MSIEHKKQNAVESRQMAFCFNLNPATDLTMILVIISLIRYSQGVDCNWFDICFIARFVIVGWNFEFWPMAAATATIDCAASFQIMSINKRNNKRLSSILFILIL